MEKMTMILLGVVLVLIGISNYKGNINSLHSYHRKRVQEEDRVPFGRLVGTGTILVGFSLIVSAALAIAGVSEMIQEVVTVAGLVAGIPIITYAMFKYNKGIF